MTRPYISLPGLAPWCLAVLAALVASAPGAQPRGDPPPGDYRVVDGKVDRGTYAGWRLFHTTCYGCHGVGGGGTDIAPDLVERIKGMTLRAFATKVLTSYRITVPASEGSSDDRTAAREAMIEEVMRQERGARGQVIMPAWESNTEVSPHVLDLFAYLTARADGKIGPGKPGLLVEKKGKTGP